MILTTYSALARAAWFSSRPLREMPLHGTSASQVLESTGLDVATSLALTACLAGVVVSALLMAAARRRSSGPWITRVHRAHRDHWWRLPH